MNMVELVANFGNSNVVFMFDHGYGSSKREIFYFKGVNAYKTNMDKLDFRGGIGNFVWGKDQIKNYFKNSYDFDKMEIDIKKTIKATLEYGHLLGDK